MVSSVSQYFLYIMFSGVVNSKWHKKKKVSPQDRLLLSKTSDESDFAKREAVFSSHREDLCVEFRFVLLLEDKEIKNFQF